MREVYPDFIRNLCQLRDDVRLGSACLDSLVEDVHLAERDMENKPVETVELNVPALVENAGQDEEKSSDNMEDSLLGNQETTPEGKEESEIQPVATEPEVPDTSAAGDGRKKNRRNRHS